MTPALIETLPESDISVKKPLPGSCEGTENPSFVLREQGHFYYEGRPVPILPSDKHVVVAIEATGLCGSDVHYYQHGQCGSFKVTKPIILGHESAGTVYSCGTGVTSLQPGDTVALEPGIPCRACSYCRGGRYNLCADMQFAATPPYDGTLTKYYAVPEDFCYKLPSHISMEEGALLEPLSVAVHCAKLAGLAFGDSVLVLGAGPIGLLCCATARAFGAAHAVCVDIVEARLDFAKTYAATATYKMGSLHPEGNAEAILSTTGVTEGFDIVIDATGAQPCISTGIHALRRGGKFIQAGLGASEIVFPVAQLCSKEGSYVGSFRYCAGDYATALKLVEKGRVSLKELITHRYSFDDAEAAFENVVQRSGIKTIIKGPGVV